MSSTKSRPQGKPWVHPPESLIKGQVVYNVKFLGHVEVDQPKGSEMVRDAIRKMKFNRQIKKAEGEKPAKVDLVITIDAMKVLDPKYKTVMHQYPLHHVSYCADDKSDKRMFTFIAKEKDSNKHQCLVFDSEKLAQEITLTVGQAFDLAYRRFLDASSRDIDAKKQLLVLQRKIQELTQENMTLKQQVAILEKMLDNKQLDNLNNRNKPEPFVGRRLENLILGSSSSTSAVSRPSPPATAADTNGSNGFHPAVTSPSVGSDRVIMPILAPPPPIPSRSFNSSAAAADPKTNQAVDLFGASPFALTSPVSSSSAITSPSAPFSTTDGGLAAMGSDVFGMETFNPSTLQSYDLDRQIQDMDKEMLDLEANFSRGLSFGTEDFSLDDLDPLKK